MAAGKGKEEKLKGKVAVVTGASRGLGSFIARELAGAGARVVITGRKEETLRAAAQKMGGEVFPESCDHRDLESVESLGRRVVEQFGPPHILINNAGALQKGRIPVSEFPLEEWNRIIDTNLTGVFLTTRAFLPGMMERDEGEIVMISSTSGLRADPGSAAYNASKFGLRGFSEALGREVRSRNIRVTLLSPSSIDMGDPPGPEVGKGTRLHAADLAKTVLHLVTLPGRTFVKELEIWGTNP